ncbi:MAG: anaerobic glycerol-3-phosphate dehydrogenase subunit C [Planctomycetota bacterium]
MDQERSRIAADLNGLLDGEVRCDDLFLQMYSSDASIHEIRPMGVVRPRHTADVANTIKYAVENRLTIHCRGSGSNVIGGCLGAGLILDFSSDMRQITARADGTVDVQPGAILSSVNRELKRRGFVFGPDPATRSVTTMGGVLSLNLTGSHWARFGCPRDKVISLEVVLASGKVVNLYSALSADFPNNSSDPVVSGLQSRLDGILTQWQKPLDEVRPKTLINQAGYNLHDLRVSDQVDLTRLLVGSEGTLGVITRAHLKAEPLPKYRGVALLSFDRLDAAARAAVEINSLDVSACDLLDRRLLVLARETNPQLVRLVPPAAEAMLLVEYQTETDAELREKLENLSYRIVRRRKLAFDARLTTQEEERNLFWRLTRRVTPTLYRLRGNRRALPFVEDIAVTPAKLPEFLQAAHQILNRHEVTASIFSHTPQGLIQLHPFLDLSSPRDVQLLERLSKDLFAKALEFGGTASGSFGDGRTRTWHLRKQYQKAYDALVEVKQLFDPEEKLNPGIIVGSGAESSADNLRRLTPVLVPPAQPPEDAKPETQANSLPVLQPQLPWSISDISNTTRNCNGCGRCRTAADDQRMCPIFRLSPREEASPRAKANLMRSILTGQLPVETMATDEFKAVADLCVNCHQCRLECPAGVDIPKLMVEAKAQYVTVNGLSISDWIFARLDVLYDLAGRLPRVTNQLIRSRLARMLLDRMLGIAQGRKLPRLSQMSFLRWAQRNKLSRGSRQHARKVVIFADAYVNWNDLELGQALVKVLQHNGIDVAVPQDQLVSGMSLISDGVLSRARKLAARNVELLAEYVRQGYKIVTTEPSAALALKHEYLNLLDDDDARLVAANTYEATHFLWELHQTGQLELDFRPVNQTVGYHLPCHQRALETGTPGINLMRLVPGLQVELIEKGCSGMCGTFGLKRRNYIRSLRTGLPLIKAMRSPAFVAGATECSTCKIQMEQGTNKPTIHPLKIIALAYGLMPQLGDLFNRRNEDLVVS